MPKIVLWGSSYGTHLGLAIIRHHSPGVLRALFSGIEGPDQTLKLPRTVDEQFAAIGRLIARSPLISRRVPSLTRLVQSVLINAERTLFVILVADALPPEGTKLVLGRFDMEQVVVGTIGTRTGKAKLPATLLALGKRELSVVNCSRASALSDRDPHRLDRLRDVVRDGLRIERV